MSLNENNMIESNRTSSIVRTRLPQATISSQEIPVGRANRDRDGGTDCSTGKTEKIFAANFSTQNAQLSCQTRKSCAIGRQKLKECKVSSWSGRKRPGYLNASSVMYRRRRITHVLINAPREVTSWLGTKILSLARGSQKSRKVAHLLF